MKKLLFVLSLVPITSMGQVFESFNFSGALNANGWTTHSGAIPGQQQTLTSASDQGNSLYYTNLPNSTGNRTTLVAGNTEDVNKAITGITGTGYYSMLVKVTNTTGLTTTGDYFTGFGATTGILVNIFAPRVWIKAGITPNTFQLGVQNTTGGTPTQTYTSTEYPVGVTLMVVIKLDATVSPIQASLFVNPNVTQAEPAPTVSNNSGTNPFSNFASIFIRQGTSTGNIELDEIRYGSTWESVTPENSCSTTASLTINTCNAYTVPSGDETYTVSGTYVDTIPNAALCDSLITINLTISTGITYYADVDGDGLGNPANTTIGCSLPVGFVTNSNDCNDANNAIGLPTTTYYQDADGDSFGSATATILACSLPNGYVTNNLDCNDNSNTINPNGTDIPDNGIDEDCSGSDASSLGSALAIYEFNGNDCTLPSWGVTAQPSNATFSDYSANGSTLVCANANGVFNYSGFNTNAALDLTQYFGFTVTPANCIGLDLNLIKFTHRTSGSGGTPIIYVRSSLDNFTADLYAETLTVAATNVTDTVFLTSAFDNVSSAVEFRFYVTSIGQTGSTYRHDNVSVIGNSISLTPQSFYQDIDGDGFGNPSVTVSQCAAPSGYVANNTDCDDANALVNPNTIWYQDLDVDTYGNSSVTYTGCIPPANYVLNNTDCNDNSSATVGPTTYYIDVDNDGYGSATDTGLVSCTNPGAGYVTTNTDCDDAENTVFPGAPEICDGLDNDCVNGIDDGLTFIPYFEDLDGDNFGTSTSVLLCEVPLSGYSLVDGDCNDSNINIHPGATEIMDNGIDENCDGTDNYAGLTTLSNILVEVKPNPSNGLIQLVSNTEMSAKITVISMQGQIIENCEWKGMNTQLDLSSLYSGIYTICIEQSGSQAFKRVIIE
jgi:hypothetical protein